MHCHFEFKLEIELGKCLDEVCNQGKATLIVANFSEVAEYVGKLKVLPFGSELEHVVVHD
jgi:hypothetical protein